MHKMLLALFTVTCLVATQVFGIDQDYYWREYTGVVPGDAVPGGKDLDGNKVFIGQVFVQNFGIIVGQIWHDSKDISVEVGGKIHTVSAEMKILCSPHIRSFVWKEANATTFHVDFVDQHPVVAGLQKDYTQYVVLHVGRVKFHGDVVIGKVGTFKAGNTTMYYAYKNQMYGPIDSFEVLTYVL